jgi:hypothetical protein
MLLSLSVRCAVCQGFLLLQQGNKRLAEKTLRDAVNSDTTCHQAWLVCSRWDRLKLRSEFKVQVSVTSAVLAMLQLLRVL